MMYFLMITETRQLLHLLIESTDHKQLNNLRGRGVYPKTRSLIIQVDLPCLNASN
jgi:hypothetical protein